TSKYGENAIFFTEDMVYFDGYDTEWLLKGLSKMKKEKLYPFFSSALFSVSFARYFGVHPEIYHLDKVNFTKLFQEVIFPAILDADLSFPKKIILGLTPNRGGRGSTDNWPCTDELIAQHTQALH